MKVSVIITTKNSVRSLSTLLKSLKQQTFKNFEIIVVDNSSTDKTLEIAKKFTKKVFMKGPERSAQRNFGVAKSKGEYVLILDADMELQKNVVLECVELAKKDNVGAIIVPERTVGEGFIPSIRKFEREMYEGDSTIELARFYSKKIYLKVGGYDEDLTGPEDYDLFYRVSKKTRVGRIRSYILHHEEGSRLADLLRKKFYYASKGALYAEKHPELIKRQGTILFRKSYLKNWKKFIQNPFLGISFLIVRVLETIWAVSGYIRAAGFREFFKNLLLMFSNTPQTKN